MERLKPFTASPRRASLTPGRARRRARAYFPMLGPSASALKYAIAENFTVNVEYLYDFINGRPAEFNPVPGSSIPFGTRTAYHIARVGLNYHLDWLSPLSSQNTRAGPEKAESGG